MFISKMNLIILGVILFIIPNAILSQSITLGDDGIVRCKDVAIGTTQTIFGETYEVVDRDSLIVRRNEGKDLTKVCVSNVTDMSEMFRNSQFNQAIGNWDVSLVTNMENMFRNSQFNQQIGNWDVSLVTNMSSMFQESPFNQPIGDWDVSQVTDMGFMFSSSTFNQPIGDWDLSSVKVINGIFSSSPFNQSIGDWDISNVSDMSEMFRNSQFNQPIGNWDVSLVTNMENTFANSPFNQPIGNWDVSSVTNMQRMFNSSPFNQPIGDWNVSSVTNMQWMFYHTSFNQPIGNWDVSSVTNMSYMFGGSQFNQPIGNWDVSSVTNMEYLFFQSSKFNQPIENWNVSSVTNMSRMFAGSSQRQTPFNQPIGNWDVSNVTNMDRMFFRAQFNQLLNMWCVLNIPNEPWDFSTHSTLLTDQKPIWSTCPILTPPIPAVVSPIQNDVNISRTAKIVWTSDTLSTKYQLQIFKGFDPIIVDTNVSKNYFMPVEPFEEFQDYYWRVRGINENKLFQGEPMVGKWSSINKFSTGTGVIGLVNLYSPKNNSPAVSVTPTFNWLKEPNSQKYIIQISDDNFRTVLVEEETVDTLYSFESTLSYITNYQWRVKGSNFIGESEWSETWDFSTIRDPNADLEISTSLLERWNIVGISVQVDHTNFSQLFANAVESTLFGFTNIYQLQETLEPGKGYWIRMNQAGSTTLRGAPIEYLNLELQSGWNLISGPSESVAVSSIEDSDEIIIPGSIFGFNGSYVNVSSIEPGRGYWVRTNQAGTIILRGGAASKSTQSSPSLALSGFDRIEFLSGSEDKPVSTLYLNGSIPSPYSAINFELPPVPPAGNVDVRWEGGSYVSESNRAVALIQQGSSPLMVKIPEFFADEAQSGSNPGSVSIREFVGDQLINQVQIQRGELFTLSGQTNRIEFELQEKADLPAEFTLYQNYPNPFNPTTTIRFGLPESADVSLEVYTVLGQKVMTLVNENRSAGWHTVSFNGGGLSSGVYVYRIQAGGMVQTRKLLLMK
jgi:surface protein